MNDCLVTISLLCIELKQDTMLDLTHEHLRNGRGLTNQTHNNVEAVFGQSDTSSKIVLLGKNSLEDLGPNRLISTPKIAPSSETICVISAIKKIYVFVESHFDFIARFGPIFATYMIDRQGINLYQCV